MAADAPNLDALSQCLDDPTMPLAYHLAQAQLVIAECRRLRAALAQAAQARDALAQAVRSQMVIGHIHVAADCAICHALPSTTDG